MTDTPDLKARLRLRSKPPRVTRLSRKVLIGAGGVAGIAIAGALFWALDTNRRGNQSATELYNVDGKTPADGLAGLPKDYTSVPKLGPALPGDLGRPILRAQEQGKPVVAPSIQTPRVDPEEQRRLAEIEAARLAKLFTDSRGERTASGHSSLQNALRTLRLSLSCLMATQTLSRAWTTNGRRVETRFSSVKRRIASTGGGQQTTKGSTC